MNPASMPDSDPCGITGEPDPDVDVSQIDELLSLTVTERLLRHERALILMDELRKAGRKLYGFDPRAIVEAAESSR